MPLFSAVFPTCSRLKQASFSLFFGQDHVLFIFLTLMKVSNVVNWSRWRHAWLLDKWYNSCKL